MVEYIGACHRVQFVNKSSVELPRTASAILCSNTYDGSGGAYAGEEVQSVAVRAKAGIESEKTAGCGTGHFPGDSSEPHHR